MSKPVVVIADFVKHGCKPGDLREIHFEGGYPIFIFKKDCERQAVYKEAIKKGWAELTLSKQGDIVVDIAPSNAMEASRRPFPRSRSHSQPQPVEA